jgi:hypothetical protein
MTWEEVPRAKDPRLNHASDVAWGWGVYTGSISSGRRRRRPGAYGKQWADCCAKVTGIGPKVQSIPEPAGRASLSNLNALGAHRGQLGRTLRDTKV